MAPLLHDYVRALVALLSHPANVELLSAWDGESWLTCADFFVDAVTRLLEGGDRDLGGPLARASPVPGGGGGSGAFTPSLAFSTGRSSTASTQRSSSLIPSKVLEQVVQGLLALVAAPNAPVQKRAAVISGAIIQVLQLRNVSVGSLHQAAFAALTFITSHVQADDLALASSIAREILPLVAHWWHGRTSATQSESLNSVREEILRTVFALQLHVEALAQDDTQANIVGHVVEVLDALWTEYSKREDRTRLQTGDLTFSSIPTKRISITRVFGLRPYDMLAERRWAVVDVIALLEAIYVRMWGTDKSPAGCGGGAAAQEEAADRSSVNSASQPVAISRPGCQVDCPPGRAFLSHQVQEHAGRYHGGPRGTGGTHQQ